MVNQIEESTGSQGSFLCDRDAFQLQKKDFPLTGKPFFIFIFIFIFIFYCLKPKKRFKSSYPVLLRHPVNLHETHIVAYPLIFFP